MHKTACRMLAAGTALLAFALAVDAGAQQPPVKIGVLYPLTGNAASAGTHAKLASELGADIVNNGDPELAKLMPIAKGGGLSGLKGAKIEIVAADNQGTPAAGQNQTLRLITQEKVVAMIGSYQSGITQTASAVAEKYGIPFLTPESTGAISPSAASSGSSAPHQSRSISRRPMPRSSRSRRRPARRSIRSPSSTRTPSTGPRHPTPSPTSSPRKGSTSR